jgi:diacylglycerol O-acyltransferase
MLEGRLSAVDAAFLYLERKEIPLNIQGVGIFDGPIPLDQFIANLESKLHLLPRYRQVVKAPPFNIGHPTWENDPDFNIRNHVHRVRLKAPGGDAELEALGGRLFGTLMDRSKPLWDIHLVDGLKNGSGAMILRVHHALADGVAGMEILKIIFDPTLEGSRAAHKPVPRTPQAARPEHSLADALSEAVYSSLENLITAEACLLGMGQALFSDRTKKGLQGLTELLPEIPASVERFPFNKPCGGERKICWTEFDFEDVKGIRTALGGTVNDVVLTVVSRATSRYIKLHGEPVAGRFLRMVCPVSVRRQDQQESLGNQITFLPVSLPLGVRDPVQNFRAVASRMEIMKSVHAADLVALAASWLGAAPPPLQAMFWAAIPQVTLPVPLLNMICTNVPGSPIPLYSAGRRLLTAYPYVPTGYELGIGTAVQSYAGKLCFGFTADAQVAPDVGRLRDFVRESFEELSRAAGLKKAPRKPRAPRKPAKPKAEAAPEAPAEPAQQPAAAPLAMGATAGG